VDDLDVPAILDFLESRQRIALRRAARVSLAEDAPSNESLRGDRAADLIQVFRSDDRLRPNPAGRPPIV